VRQRHLGQWNPQRRGELAERHALGDPFLRAPHVGPGRRERRERVDRDGHRPIREVTGDGEDGVRRADPHQQLDRDARGVHPGIGAQQVGRGAGVLQLRLGHFALGDVARTQPYRVGLQQLSKDLAPIAGESALPLGQQEVEECLTHGERDFPHGILGVGPRSRHAAACRAGAQEAQRRHVERQRHRVLPRLVRGGSQDGVGDRACDPLLPVRAVGPQAGG